MGLKIAEAFIDRCLLIVTATGARATLLADVTCQVYDEAGVAFGAAIVATEGADGWYYAQFTPDAAGTWSTGWSKTLVPENYTFHYPYKIFHVGAGQEADIYARVGAPAGASVSADIAAIKAETASILTDTGTTLDDLVDDLETRLSAARGGYLDILNTDSKYLVTTAIPGGVAAGSIGKVVQSIETKVDAVDDLLDTEVAAIDTKVTAVNTDLGDWSARVNLQSALTSLGIPDLAGKDLYTCLITDRLDNATYGLAALETLVDDLESRLTAARAGYLDNLANHQNTKIFFSTLDDVIDLSATAADVNLPDVILPNITGTIDMVYVGIIVNELENTSASGANGINVAQNIRVKKSTGTWGVDDIAAINLKDNQWMVPASTAGLSRFQGGDINVASEVDAFNATYNLRFEDADVDYDYLRLKDVQVFLMVYYH